MSVRYQPRTQNLEGPCVPKKQHHMKIPLISFRWNNRTLGFDPEALKLERLQLGVPLSGDYLICQIVRFRPKTQNLKPPFIAK